jgi:hypothetical protein
VLRYFWDRPLLLFFTSGEVSECSFAGSSLDSSKTVIVLALIVVDLLALIIPCLKLTGYMLLSTIPLSLLLCRLRRFEFVPVLLEETVRICEGTTVCVLSITHYALVIKHFETAALL